MALAMGPHIAKALQFRQSYLCKIIAPNSKKSELTLIFLHYIMQCASSKASNKPGVLKYSIALLLKK